MQSNAKPLNSVSKFFYAIGTAALLVVSLAACGTSVPAPVSKSEGLQALERVAAQKRFGGQLQTSGLVEDEGKNYTVSYIEKGKADANGNVESLMVVEDAKTGAFQLYAMSVPTSQDEVSANFKQSFVTQTLDANGNVLKTSTLADMNTDEVGVDAVPFWIWRIVARHAWGVLARFGKGITCHFLIQQMERSMRWDIPWWAEVGVCAAVGL